MAETIEVSNKKENNKKENVTNKNTLAIWISLLSVVFFAVFAFSSFQAYKNSKQLSAEQQVQIAQLNQRIEAVKKAQNTNDDKNAQLKVGFENQVKQLQSQLKKFENKNKIYKTDVQALQRSFAEKTIRHPNDWILTEVEYLVNLSAHKIWLEHDIKSAIALLSAADQRVLELNDASLTPLRSALLEDIAMLEALPKRDTDSLILKLSSLEQRVSKLTTGHLSVPEDVVSDKTELSTDVSDWKSNLKKSWAAFVDNFVVVSYQDNKVRPLLTADQIWYLKASLRADIAKAEFAIYREHQSIYNIALENLQKTVNDYFDLDDNRTQHFLKSVKRLSKQKINIHYPDQLHSQPILANILELRIKKSLALNAK
jgi:uroporphyrin-3 C-methyltransferase